MSRHTDTATSYFIQGYNCAQSTAAAFADDLGLDVALVLRMAVGFGAGMGGLRETCGAVSGMVLVASLKAGDFAPNDRVAKKALYDVIKLMHGKFVDCHGTTCCRDLLKKAAIEPQPDPSERTAEYYRVRPCVRFVLTAAEIIDRELFANVE